VSTFPTLLARTRVPSHGTHELGQTHAVDLIHLPDETQTWRAVRAWPPMSPPERFPSFGRPIVVLRLDSGEYTTYAHLRRRSVIVSAGDRVSAGEQIASCGNSGNSSEPHLHIQLTDVRWLPFAVGLPFGFDFHVDGRRRHGMPPGRQPFTVEP
jgi:hypothetical protein